MSGWDMAAMTLSAVAFLVTVMRPDPPRDGRETLGGYLHGIDSSIKDLTRELARGREERRQADAKTRQDELLKK